MFSGVKGFRALRVLGFLGLGVCQGSGDLVFFFLIDLGLQVSGFRTGFCILRLVVSGVYDLGI